MKAPLLSGLIVLDLSDTIAGQFATRIMADYGAWVCLVEAPSGSPVRARAPFFDADTNESMLFWHLNAGKNSVVLDRSDRAEWSRLVELCKKADAIVVADPELAKGLEIECPHLVVGLVSDFGGRGPYADWVGCELIHQALSGSMFVSGLPGRPPLFGVGERASYAAGLWLYISMMAALYARQAHGDANGVCEVTIHEAAAAMEENFSLRWSYSRHFMERGGDSSRAVCAVECRDGWAILFLSSVSGQWRALCKVLHEDDAVDDPRFSNWGSLTRNWNAACELINLRSREWPVDDLVKACAPVGLVIARVENANSLRDDPHLRERGYWHKVETRSGSRPALGGLLNVPDSPALRNRPTPAIGEILHDPPSRNESSDGGTSSGAPPLRGVSILELTTAWAGPMSTRILALLGASVIKIEGPQWLDSWRGPLSPARFEQYPDGDAGERPYNRCVRFNAQNLGKFDVALDLKSDEGRALLHRIVRDMDVVVANLRPGALRRIGLDFETLSRENQRASVVEMSVVGKGPDEARIGLGPTMEAMAGIADLIGYEDTGPLGSGSSYMDPMGALHGAAAALTALYARLATGRGTFVEIAQREAAMTWIGEMLLAPSTMPARSGNVVADGCPHDAYPAKGVDEWIAIAVFDEAQWTSLCQALDMHDVATDTRFSTLSARQRNRATLYGLIAEKTRALDKFALASVLQGRRVPAAPVLNGRDLFDDPQLRVSEWFARLQHPEAGVHDYAGLPLSFGGKRLQPSSPSPCFGEHTVQILHAYANLEDDQINRLFDSGVCASSPIA